MLVGLIQRRHTCKKLFLVRVLLNRVHKKKNPNGNYCQYLKVPNSRNKVQKTVSVIQDTQQCVHVSNEGMSLKYYDMKVIFKCKYV